MKKQEELFEKRIRELAGNAYNREIVTFTDFLNPDELHRVNSRNFSDLGVHPEFWGGYECAERQMVAFLPDALSFDWSYPMACLKIEPKAAKFAETLSHRDYLGSILGLGIERAVLGDLRIGEAASYVFCIERMKGYLLEHLSSVRRTPVVVTEVSDPKELPKPKTETIEGTVASVRLDALTALAFRESRSGMIRCIEQGQVYVNGRLITTNAYSPKDGDLISLRKKGRFRYLGERGHSKKGRCFVILEKYI